MNGRYKQSLSLIVMDRFTPRSKTEPETVWRLSELAIHHFSYNDMFILQYHVVTIFVFLYYITETYPVTYSARFIASIHFVFISSVLAKNVYAIELSIFTIWNEQFHWKTSPFSFIQVKKDIRKEILLRKFVFDLWPIYFFNNSA